jgi:hypothetical protein
MLVYSSDFGNAAAVSSRANEPKRFFALQAQPVNMKNIFSSVDLKGIYGHVVSAFSLRSFFT